MTKQEATDLLPVARARVIEAYEAFAAAESELSAARAHHDFLVCTARGEYDEDRYEIGYLGVRRRPEPVQPARAWACGSRGTWSWLG